MYLFNSYIFKRNSTLNVFTSISLAALLVGCGGESNSGEEQDVIASPTESASISAQDIQDNSLVEQSFTIDLTEHVHTSNNQDFVVTNARSLSGDSCQVKGISEGSFNVFSSDVNDCMFEYEVTTSARTSIATSYARVAMGQNYSSTTLPRITASTIESQVVVVDLESELGSSLPNDDFVLQDSTITIGSGTARVSGEHQIEFTPAAKGQTEVYYSYQNGESIQQGSLSIATSEETSNTAPTVEDFAFGDLALLGENIVVDVADYISDVDLDDVQLVGVQDFNSTTSLYDPANVTNTKFEFSSTQPGSHDVAYTVSDHMGGYTTGVARIEVEPDFSLIQDWEDIVTHDPVISSDIRFFAPMTKVYADYVNAPYTGTYIENGTQGLKDAEVVTQTLSQARQYCKVRGGRLPLQRELETLITNETSAFTNHNWPTSKKYWTADNVSETNTATVHLNDGSIGNQSKTVDMYTTCVDLSNPSVSDFSVDVSVKDRVSNRYEYEVQVRDPDGNAAPFADVELESINERGVFLNREPMTSESTNEFGLLEEAYFDISFSEEVLAVRISSNDELYPFIPVDDAMAIDVTAPSLWSSEEYWNKDVYLADAEGLMLMPNVGYSKLFHIYKMPFLGDNFVIRFRVQSDSNSSKGEFAVLIQQLGTDQTTWEQDGVINTGNTRPYPENEPSAFGLNVNLYGSMPVSLFEGGQVSSSQNMNLRDSDRFYWFDKRGQRVYVYTSSTDQRPEQESGYFDISGNVDLSQPYWLSIGGKNADPSKNYRITELDMAAY
ncbi:conserved hypothetical protein [Vibrio crassostreae]|nr:conserved hypothetical protein [Vibrio crassostreae]CAK3367962.1 conserved hypothetical protein [Vibrio crassostreae]CAK3374114.1 conserved hypothetical protein [Vibrio crassostreae]CAK3396863.1 conserved hypothetical protein [Vibrio crassostreae]CAK3405241.1 conserved hypothetical protein [Vibrio crassostreae]